MDADQLFDLKLLLAEHVRLVSQGELVKRMARMAQPKHCSGGGGEEKEEQRQTTLMGREGSIKAVR